MNEEWDGTGLPPVGVKCELKRFDWTDWEVGKFTFIGTILAVFTSESRVEAVCNIDRIETRPLPPKPKKIDMSKFAGSDVLIESGDVLFIADNKSIRALKGRYCQPVFDHWNYYEGDGEPEWLEGFEFQVKEIHSHNSEITIEVQTTSYVWEDVVAIKITGVKEGWEL